MRDGFAVAAPNAPDLWTQILRSGGGGLLVYQRTVSQSGGRGAGVAGGRGAQTGTLRNLSGGAGADPGRAHPGGGTRRGTQPAPSGDLGCAGAALKRYLYRPGSGGPRAGTLDGANAAGQGVEDRGKRTDLDLGGGRRTGRL